VGTDQPTCVDSVALYDVHKFQIPFYAFEFMSCHISTYHAVLSVFVVDFYRVTCPISLTGVFV
jgi:hypothetical protein